MGFLWILHGPQSPRPHGDRTPVRPHKVRYKVRYIGVGERGEGGAVASHPNLGEKVFFGQTSCNIRAVDIFLKEERTAILSFLTIFCFHFMCTWNIALNFETRFSSTFY